MSSGLVQFVGCGPGAADLLTLRAARAIAEADIVVWNASLLEDDIVRAHAHADAQIVSWPPATEQYILDLYARAQDQGLRVVRLKGGDPALLGGLEPELEAVRSSGLSWEIVPGVSAVGAAGAALGCEVARTGTPLLLASAGDLADGVPGAVGTAVFGAGSGGAELQRALLGRGLAPDTPCAVVVSVTRPEEILETCTLRDLAETIEDFGGGGPTLVVATPALVPAPAAQPEPPSLGTSRRSQRTY